MKSVKIFGKSIPMLAIALVMIASVATVSAASTWIYSTPVTVIVTSGVPGDYVLTMTVAPGSELHVGGTIYFIGTLTYQNNPVSGAEIGLYDAATGAHIGEVGALTNENGAYTLVWVPTAEGTSTFKAGYVMP